MKQQKPFINIILRCIPGGRTLQSDPRKERKKIKKNTFKTAIPHGPHASYTQKPWGDKGIMEGF